MAIPSSSSSGATVDPSPLMSPAYAEHECKERMFPPSVDEDEADVLAPDDDQGAVFGDAKEDEAEIEETIEQLNRAMSTESDTKDAEVCSHDYHPLAVHLLQ